MSRAIFVIMFVRKKKNKSGSISVQIISKSEGKYKVLKTIGSSNNPKTVEDMYITAKHEIKNLEGKYFLFSSPTDVIVENVFGDIENSSIRTIGPELIFGKIYDSIGYNQIEEELFRHLVISRLSFPLSKLKTVEYIRRYQGKHLNIDKVYQFLDKLNDTLKIKVEQISYNHTKKILGELNIVFYDMTTLYFEASDEDDLRKTGFNKDGKHQHPQIYIGLLVGIEGYAIGYDIFEGNIYEGHTLIPFLDKINQKYDISQPTVIADSGLLSHKNIELLEENGYKYIMGSRLKSESQEIKQKILNLNYNEGKSYRIIKNDKQSLIINYSSKRARKDEHNRRRGLQRLEKKVKGGKLTKSSINNRGYNKFLELEGEVEVKINEKKIEEDKLWDGLKGYVTNSSLSNKEIIANYKNLWHIEKAFRMSKTDLRIRPVYHRLKRRIEAHICISFVAYTIYKELERILKYEDATISLKQASELTQNMYAIIYTLPESKIEKTQVLKMDDKQTELYNIIMKNF